MNARSIAAGAAATAGALSLLSRVEVVSNPTLRIDAGIVLVLVVSVYSLILDWRLGLGVLGFSIVLYVVGAVLPLWLSLSLLIAGGAFLGAALVSDRTDRTGRTDTTDRE